MIEVEASLLSKLGSITVHVEELFSGDGHAFDEVALESLINDDEVQVWLFKMAEQSLLPLKRQDTEQPKDYEEIK